MIRSFALLATAAAALAASAAGAITAAHGDGTGASPVASQAAPTTLRLDGIGPLRLGMTRAAALRTGWLARRGTGCELGGDPLPITYRLSGARAPTGVGGTAEFDGASKRLTNLSFTRGVRTATGVVVGQTTARGMVNRYRDAGFTARAQFVDTFLGTFVTVTRRGQQRIGGFANRRPSARRPISTLGIPFVPTCD
jgi:hypothetical protein